MHAFTHTSLFVRNKGVTAAYTYMTLGIFIVLFRQDISSSLSLGLKSDQPISSVTAYDEDIILKLISIFV